MRSKQTLFFAVLEDIQALIQEIETSVNVRYVKAGLFETKDIPIYSSLFSVPNPGVTLSGDWNRVDSYLVLKATAILKIRDVPQRSGQIKYAVDQMINPNSIELKVGGIYKEKENVLVAGRIATISEADDSNHLYELYARRIKRTFKKIGSFYVGRIAEEKLKEGWRLVTNEKSPREYDLTFL